MNNLLVVTYFIIASFVSGCSPEFSKEFISTDQEYMRLFVQELQRSNIAYIEGESGAIRYKNKDDNKIIKLREKIDKKISSAITAKYDDDIETRNYLRSLLDKNKVDYSEEKRGDDYWITWYPSSQDQKTEISFLIVKYFSDKKVKASEGCSIEKLRPYEITLVDTHDNKKYIGKIFFPEISKIEEEFCGFWNQEKLTDGKNRKYAGYKELVILIDLEPRLSDGGYTLELIDLGKWDQEGVLKADSVAGEYSRGKFVIFSE